MTLSFDYGVYWKRRSGNIYCKQRNEGTCIHSKYLFYCLFICLNDCFVSFVLKSTSIILCHLVRRVCDTQTVLKVCVPCNLFVLMYRQTGNLTSVFVLSTEIFNNLWILQGYLMHCKDSCKTNCNENTKCEIVHPYITTILYRVFEKWGLWLSVYGLNDAIVLGCM